MNPTPYGILIKYVFNVKRYFRYTGQVLGSECGQRVVYIFLLLLSKFMSLGGEP